MVRKKWSVARNLVDSGKPASVDDIMSALFGIRGFTTPAEICAFLNPANPKNLKCSDVGIDEKEFSRGIERIVRAIRDRESMVVYADYDADGVTAGAVMWETVHALGGRIMPYIPSRSDEGYGLSEKGIDFVRKEYGATLIVTVDHGITAFEKVAHAKSLGLDVVITDHHVKPDRLPDCPIIHTTALSGSGISWFVANHLTDRMKPADRTGIDDLLGVAAIGTIADMVPLIGPNRSIAKFGLAAINKTTRVGIVALIKQAGLAPGELRTYDISHVLAPRLNAMGRLVHAMDALRLLCTRDEEKANTLAVTLGETNSLRQQMTIDTTLHATEKVKDARKKLLFVSHDSYNQGIIGLVAGKLVDTYYRPAIVIARGEVVSKGSARSVPGFNIVDAIRSVNDILVDVGGHPMAAGFTVETKYLDELERRLEEVAENTLPDELLTRTMKVDAEIPLSSVTDAIWEEIRRFEPFGFGNAEPVFATRGVSITDMRLVGADGKHLKVGVLDPQSHNSFDGIAFGLGELFGSIPTQTPVDIAYTVDMNIWKGRKKIQLKIRDIV